MPAASSPAPPAPPRSALPRPRSKTLHAGDLWDVAAQDGAAAVSDTFQWNLQAADGVVWRAMWRTHGRVFVMGAPRGWPGRLAAAAVLWPRGGQAMSAHLPPRPCPCPHAAGLVKLAHDTVMFLGPLLLELLLRHLQARGSGAAGAVSAMAHRRSRLCCWDHAGRGAASLHGARPPARRLCRAPPCSLGRPGAGQRPCGGQRGGDPDRQRVLPHPLPRLPASQGVYVCVCGGGGGSECGRLKRAACVRVCVLCVCVGGGGGGVGWGGRLGVLVLSQCPCPCPRQSWY